MFSDSATTITTTTMTSATQNHHDYHNSGPTTIRRKQSVWSSSSSDGIRKRAGIPRGALLLAAILSVLSSTAFTTPLCVGASTLPFGRTTTAFSRRKQLPDPHETTAPGDGGGRSSAVRSIFRTRAGSSGASFVGPAASSLGLEPLSYYLRVALAGGVAGATGSAVLYPIDSAKTLRQSDPSAYSSVRDALVKMLRSKNSLQRVYRGVLPAALGAIPSSALYFGAYESSKVVLQRCFVDARNSKGESDNGRGYRTRLFVHGLAAASGNVISSFVFVPKEVIKQQLQIRAGEGSVAASTIGSIVRQKGISGLYAGYGATLLRNIPSATIRFVLYEELKRKWASSEAAAADENNAASKQKIRAAGTFLAGAVAGSTSSFLMTPIDVVKTRMATGSCPLGVKNCMVHVVREVGYKGLYAGAGSRVLWSGAFSAIGFGTFEMVKGYLGVSSAASSAASAAAPTMTTTTPRTVGTRR